MLAISFFYGPHDSATPRDVAWLSQREAAGEPMQTMGTLTLLLFCAAWNTASGLAQTATPHARAADDGSRIDRRALVTRHNIAVHDLDPMGAMDVGILSDWGWHRFPNPNGYTLENFPVQPKVHSLAVDPETHRAYTPEEQENGHGVARMIVYEAVVNQ